MKVLVTGASGFVGKILIKQLQQAHHEVVVLTRNIAKAAIELGSECKYFYWDSAHEPAPAEAFSEVEAVINLMGEGIADKRWSEDQKKRIYNSRIDSTRKLVEAIQALPKKPKAFISTSAVGIYGPRASEELSETSPLGSDFLAHVCKDWEKEATQLQADLRVVIIRVGVVLGKKGGALKKMLPIFKLGGGGPTGSGKQFMSWIQVEDLAQIYVKAVETQEMRGVYNATAPYPVTSKEFAKTLGQALCRPAFAPAPAFVLKLAFGEMSTVILDGQKVIPARLKEMGFQFRYASLEMALKESIQ